MTKAFAEAFFGQIGRPTANKRRDNSFFPFFSSGESRRQRVTLFLRRARINAYTRGTAPQNPSWTHNSDRAGGPWRNSWGGNPNVNKPRPQKAWPYKLSPRAVRVHPSRISSWRRIAARLIVPHALSRYITLTAAAAAAANCVATGQYQNAKTAKTALEASRPLRFGCSSLIYIRRDSRRVSRLMMSENIIYLASIYKEKNI